MKTSRWVLALVLSGSMILPVMAFETPTADQIAGVVADHSQLDALVADASPEQMASVVASALAGIKASSMTDADKNQATALLYTRALLLSGEKAPQMAGSLAGQVDPLALPIIAAATSIAMGGSEGPVFAALTGAAGSGKGIGDAAANPGSVLDADSVAMVQQLVIEMRGVAAPVIPPPSTAPLPLVPPVVPQGAGAPTPPPAAPPYVNQ